MVGQNKYIIDCRQQAINNFKGDVDDVAFVIYQCPSCNLETISIIALPINDKVRISLIALLQAQKSVFEELSKRKFNFLNEEKLCDCSFISPKKLELETVIYCFLNGGVDYHYYRHFQSKTTDIYKHSVLAKESLPIETYSNNVPFYIFFDTETTGLPVNWNAKHSDTNNWPRLVQIAWQITSKKGKCLEKVNYIIKPNGFTIPVEASSIHGISANDAIKYGYDLMDILRELNKKINSIQAIVCHNVNFDINVVAAEFYRMGIESDILLKKSICTMVSTVDYCKLSGQNGYKYPKLSDLYRKLFNVHFNEEHNAQKDTQATVDCFFELLKNGLIF